MEDQKQDQKPDRTTINTINKETESGSSQLIDVLSVEEMLEYDPPEYYSAFPHLDNIFMPFRGMLASMIGSPGAGKSRWSMHFACQMARLYDHRTGILSMEMLPHFVGKCLNAYGKAWYCEDAVHRNVKMLRPKKDREPTLEWLDYCVRHMRMDWLIIDPFNQIEKSAKHKSQVQQQKEDLQLLGRLANDTGIGLIVVAHPTKAVYDQDDGTVREPTYYDFDGSSHFANRSDYCIGMTRNPQTNVVKFKTMKVRHQDAVKPGAQYLVLNEKGLYIPTDKP